MALIPLEITAYVLYTSAAKHLISTRMTRTWCNRIDHRQAISIISLYEVTGYNLSEALRDSLCPKCLHYYDWLLRHSLKQLN